MARTIFLLPFFVLLSGGALAQEEGKRVIDEKTQISTRFAWSAPQGGWIKKNVDLSTYVGQTVELSIQIQSDEYYLSSLFLDDVSMEPGPPISLQVYLPLILQP